MHAKDENGKRIELPKADLEITDVPREILAAFGFENGKFVEECEKLAVLVVDGLSYEIAKGIFSEAKSMLSTVPSSTPIAITSMVSGLKPAEHGITSEVFFLPPYGLFNPLTFTDVNGLPVNASSAEVFPFSTIFEELSLLGIQPYALLNLNYSTSGFSNIILRGSKVAPITGLGSLYEKLKRLSKKEMIFIYWEEPDIMLHEGFGKTGIKWEIKHLLATIKSSLKDHSLLILSDHGHIKMKKVPVDIGVEAFRLPVGGGIRNLQMWVKERYRDEIIEKMAQLAYIFDGRKLIDSGLLGKNIWEESYERIGDLVAIPSSQVTPYIFKKPDFKSGHGGLSTSEMLASFVFMQR